jgi:thymidylate synthase
MTVKPFSKRTPDAQYHDLLRRIFEEGRDVAPIHGTLAGNKAGEKAKMLVGAQLRYELENGFPVITERDLSGLFRGALAEHVAFLNGARTQAELERFGCKWWSKWVTKEKCDGSYGAAWAAFPTKEGKPFNQIAHLIRQIKERPFLRTHFVSPWIPQYTLQHEGLTRKVVVAPCHGWIHVLCFPDTKELAIHHFQRSADFPVGVPFNMIQYAAFGLMVSQLIGYTLREVVYTFSDVHIYESQYEKVRELLERGPRRLPTVTLDPSITDIFAFRPEHFTLSDYEPHPKMGIPTPV